MTHSSDTIPLVDLKAQYQTIKGEIAQAMQRVLDEAHYILGDEVKQFEADYAAFSQCSHALGISNGLDALRIALLALKIGPGDEVIVPANSFIATALAVSGVGATPVMVDCDRATYQIDVHGIAAAITPRTKALMPVHLTGLAADMDPINALAKKHGLHVVEDAAQSQGSLYKGRPCGGLSRIGCTSFFPGKNLGAYGDAGGITTNDEECFKTMALLRNYGSVVKYHHEIQGLNCRLDNLQAAVLRVKLKHLPAWNEARRRHAAAYKAQLQGVGDLVFQTIPAECVTNYHLFIVETSRRDALKDYLAARNIQCGIHYPVPIHLQPAYAALRYKTGSMPNAEYLAPRILSLPMYAELTAAQIARVTDATKAFFKGH